jgi:putative DNA primase/helicase
VRSDMVRRTLICRLDPNMERPETRKFKRNPFKDVLADRGKYIGAAMTISRAYLAAGEPGVRGIELASFGAWSRFVQGPLIWLGKADPAGSVENNSGDDPEQNALRAVLTAWHAAIPKNAVMVKELTATQSDELREALREAAPGKDGEIDSRRLGNYLARM